LKPVTAGAGRNAEGSPIALVSGVGTPELNAGLEHLLVKLSPEERLHD
jgi:hypothetical protein